MFTLVGACSVVGSRKVGSHPALGWIMVTILSLGRLILVLPFVEQPRFYLDGFNVAQVADMIKMMMGDKYRIYIPDGYSGAR